MQRSLTLFPPSQQRLHKLQFLKKLGCQKPYWDQARLSSLVNKPVVEIRSSCLSPNLATQYITVPYSTWKAVRVLSRCPPLSPGSRYRAGFSLRTRQPRLMLLLATQPRPLPGRHSSLYIMASSLASLSFFALLTSLFSLAFQALWPSYPSWPSWTPFRWSSWPTNLALGSHLRLCT